MKHKGKSKSRDLDYDPVDRKRKIAQKRQIKQKKQKAWYDDDSAFEDYIDEY